MERSGYLFTDRFCAAKNEGRRARPSTRARPAWPSQRGQSVPAASPPHATCGMSCSRCKSKLLGIHRGGRVFFSQQREPPSRRWVADHRRAGDLCIGRGVAVVEIAHTRLAGMPRSTSTMLCLLLTVVGTRAAAVQEASRATSCGFSWRLLLSWAWMGVMAEGLVQQGAPEPLFVGSEIAVRIALLDGSSMMCKSMLQHSLSGGYGVSGGGGGGRGASTHSPVAGEAEIGRERRWEAAVGGPGYTAYTRLREIQMR